MCPLRADNGRHGGATWQRARRPGGSRVVRASQASARKEKGRSPRGDRPLKSVLRKASYFVAGAAASAAGAAFFAFLAFFEAFFSAFAGFAVSVAGAATGAAAAAAGSSAKAGTETATKATATSALRIFFMMDSLVQGGLERPLRACPFRKGHAAEPRPRLLVFSSGRARSWGSAPHSGVPPVPFFPGRVCGRGLLLLPGVCNVTTCDSTRSRHGPREASTWWWSRRADLR